MIVEIHIESSKINEAVSSFGTLPSQLRPERFSDGEDANSAKGKVSDVVKYEQFVAKNGSGFFLFAERVRYNVVRRPGEAFSKIEADPQNDGLTERDVIELFQAVADAGLVFGFAACPEEYEHRNRYVRKLQGMTFEAWMGRDLNCYLPGVYWLTVLSERYGECLPEPATALSDITRVTRLGAKHWIIRAFENAGDWKQHAPRLDLWCAKRSILFSKDRIQSQLDAAADIATLSQLVSNWR